MITFSQCLKNLGLQLKKVRKRMGLRQEDLSREAGITFRHYQEIEAGRVNITLETLWRISEALGVSMAALIELCLPPAIRGRRIRED